MWGERQSGDDVTDQRLGHESTFVGEGTHYAQARLTLFQVVFDQFPARGVLPSNFSSVGWFLHACTTS
jgi:hypothetical protein